MFLYPKRNYIHDLKEVFTAPKSATLKPPWQEFIEHLCIKYLWTSCVEYSTFVKQHRMMVLTVSPPEAKDMRGMSCRATIRPDSSAVSTRPQLEMVRFTFAPACSIIGRSAMARWTRFSAFLLLSAVLSPAASHTLLMHSLRNSTKLPVKLPHWFSMSTATCNYCEFLRYKWDLSVSCSWSPDLQQSTETFSLL